MKTLKLLLSIIFILAISIVSGQDLEIYVSDAANFTSGPWKILKFDENGENPETFIADSIVWPQDIVFVEDQDVVLISNLKQSGNISKHDINTGQYIEDFASGINGPTRMKIGEDGLLYVLQWYNGNNKVLRYALDGTFVDEFTSVGVPQSIGIDWDADGNLYVSSYTGGYVQKFDTDGNDMGQFISDNLAGPTNIWFNDNGELMVNDYNGGAVKRFSATGEFVETYINGLSGPEGVAYFDNGNMLLGNGGSSAVKMFDPDGNFIEDFIPSGSGGLITPNAVVIRDLTAVSVVELPAEGNWISFSPGEGYRISPGISAKEGVLRIYNLSGNLVEIVPNLSGAGQNLFSGMPHGVYLVTASFPNGKIYTQKILIQ